MSSEDGPVLYESGHVQVPKLTDPEKCVLKLQKKAQLSTAQMSLIAKYDCFVLNV